MLPEAAGAPVADEAAPSDTLTPPPEHDTIAPPAPPTHEDIGDAEGDTP